MEQTSLGTENEIAIPVEPEVTDPPISLPVHIRGRNHA